MHHTDERLERFFADYAERFNRALAEPPVVDVEGTAAAFAGCFVEASPRGVTCGKNDDTFRATIPQGAEFYRSIGTTSMRITSLEVTPLDGYHTMAKVRWDSRYRKKDGREERIEFDVIYLVQTLGDTTKISAYITGDEQKALREKGLLP